MIFLGKKWSHVLLGHWYPNSNIDLDVETTYQVVPGLGLDQSTVEQINQGINEGFFCTIIQLYLHL